MKTKMSGTAKICLLVSAAIILVALVLSLTGSGIRSGMDFSGGLYLKYQMNGDFDVNDAKTALADMGTAQFEAGRTDTSLWVKVYGVTNDGIKPLRSGLESALAAKYTAMDVNNVQLSFLSASVAGSAQGNAIFILVLMALLAFGFVYFRYDFDFATAAIAGIVHDALIMLSFVVFLRSSLRADNLLVTAIFAVMVTGIMANGVLFRQIMENARTIKLRTMPKMEIAKLSVRQSAGRIIGITLCALLVTGMTAIIGGAALADFACPAAIGILACAASTLLLSAPIWALLQNAGSQEKASPEKA